MGRESKYKSESTESQDAAEQRSGDESKAGVVDRFACPLVPNGEVLGGSALCG
jgi:hypothetical protein